MIKAKIICEPSQFDLKIQWEWIWQKQYHVQKIALEMLQYSDSNDEALKNWIASDATSLSEDPYIVTHIRVHSFPLVTFQPDH